MDVNFSANRDGLVVTVAPLRGPSQSVLLTWLELGQVIQNGFEDAQGELEL